MVHTVIHLRNILKHTNKKGRDVCGAVQFNLSDALESVQRKKTTESVCADFRLLLPSMFFLIIKTHLIIIYRQLITL